MLAIDLKPGQELKVGQNLLGFVEGCVAVLNDLLEKSPGELAQEDLAVLNLLCAPTLAGSEHLDIPNCIARLSRLVGLVKSTIQRNMHRFPTDRQYSHSKPMWQMAHLVTCVKRDFGATYNPGIVREKELGAEEPITDSRDIFVHGLLDRDSRRRWGTCASLPVLITAVARRLGYPVHLAVAGRHVYARWDGQESFNIEVSNPAAMTVPSDEQLRQKLKDLPADHQESAYYLRGLTAAEEFSLFLTFRVELLICAARYDQTLLWAARALQFAPDDPVFPFTAHYALDLALKDRFRRAHPERKVPPPEAPFDFDAGHLLEAKERCLFLSIEAHHKEAKGQLNDARRLYEDACRQNFFGNNEQRDLQRFLRKHGLRPRPGPLMPPGNLGFARRFTLSCAPHQEAGLLRQLADRFEREGELVIARDALHDLYMFDPADADVFQRARAIEERPEFQEQLAALIEARRRALAGNTSNPLGN